MRTAALIAALVLTAGAAGAANHSPATAEVADTPEQAARRADLLRRVRAMQDAQAAEKARSQGFSCGREFVTMRHMGEHVGGGLFPENTILTIRMARIIQVMTWDEIGLSEVWFKGIKGREKTEPLMRAEAISLATATMLRKCLEDG